MSGMTMPTAKPAASEPASPQPEDHSTMDHGAMPMPPDSSPTPVTDHSAMDHGAMAGMEDAGHDAMKGALGPYPMERESSGTAW